MRDRPCSGDLQPAIWPPNECIAIHSSLAALVEERERERTGSVAAKFL